MAQRRFCILTAQACKVVLSRDECHLVTVDVFRAAEILISENYSAWGVALYRLAARWRREISRAARAGDSFRIDVSAADAEVLEGISGDPGIGRLWGCTQFVLDNAHDLLKLSKIGR